MTERGRQRYSEGGLMGNQRKTKMGWGHVGDLEEKEKKKKSYGAKEGLKGRQYHRFTLRVGNKAKNHSI